MLFNIPILLLDNIWKTKLSDNFFFNFDNQNISKTIFPPLAQQNPSNDWKLKLVQQSTSLTSPKMALPRRHSQETVWECDGESSNFRRVRQRRHLRASGEKTINLISANVRWQCFANFTWACHRVSRRRSEREYLITKAFQNKSETTVGGWWVWRWGESSRK